MIISVPWIVDVSGSRPSRTPDLPAGVESWRLIADHGDTAEIEITQWSALTEEQAGRTSAIEQAVEDALTDLQTALDAVDQQKAALTALRGSINDQTTTLQTISGTSGTLTAAQLSGGVRALADAGLVHFQASKEIGRLEAEIIDVLEVLARNQRRIIRRLIAEVRPDRRNELLSETD